MLYCHNVHRQSDSCQWLCGEENQHERRGNNFFFVYLTFAANSALICIENLFIVSVVIECLINTLTRLPSSANNQRTTVQVPKEVRMCEDYELISSAHGRRIVRSSFASSRPSKNVETEYHLPRYRPTVPCKVFLYGYHLEF